MLSKYTKIDDKLCETTFVPSGAVIFTATVWRPDVVIAETSAVALISSAVIERIVPFFPSNTTSTVLLYPDITDRTVSEDSIS